MEETKEGGFNRQAEAALYRSAQAGSPESLDRLLRQHEGLVRQIVAAGVSTPEIIEDQRQRRAVPIHIEILTTGYVEDGVVRHRLPPQPPHSA